VFLKRDRGHEWVKLWFVLHNRNLFYYKHPEVQFVVVVVVVVVIASPPGCICMWLRADSLKR